MLYKCGCGEEVKSGNYIYGHQNRNRVPWNKGLKGIYSDETKSKWSEKRKNVKLLDSHKEKLKGRIPWNKGKVGIQVCSEETKIKLREKMTGKKIHSIEHKEKLRERMLNGGSSYCSSFIDKDKLRNKMRNLLLNGQSNYMNSFPVKGYKNHKEWMLNGGAIYMIKHIKNPSKLEIKLREMVKELYPTCEFQYQVLNYALDVAITEYKIAIEYDGYYHFDSQESINYHKNRKERIEKEGWKFINYTIFDKFPDLSKLKDDIKRIIL